MRWFKRRCRAHMGTTIWIDGRCNFRCELDDDGHEFHERKGPPVAARWREVEGGRHFYMGAGNSAITVLGDK